MVVYQFNNEPYRLFLALCASGLPQTDQFIHGTLQKHILREIRVTEAAVKGNVAWNNRSNRFTVTSDKITEAKNDQEGEGEDDAADERMQGEAGAASKPTRNNPVLYTIYGQSCSAAKSFQSSICTYSIKEVREYHAEIPKFQSICFKRMKIADLTR